MHAATYTLELDIATVTGLVVFTVAHVFGVIPAFVSAVCTVQVHQYIPVYASTRRLTRGNVCFAMCTACNEECNCSTAADDKCVDLHLDWQISPYIVGLGRDTG